MNTYEKQIECLKPRKSTFLQALGFGIILLGIEFDFSFYGIVTLRKIAFLMLIIYSLLRHARLKSFVRRGSLLMGVGMGTLLIYVFFLHIMRTDTISIEGNFSLTEINLIQQYFLLTLFPLIISRMFHTTDEFCAIQLGVIMTQSIVAIMGRLIAPLRLYLFYKVYDDGRGLDGVMRGVRVPIIGSLGASASWILFSGCVLCTYFLLKRTRPDSRYLTLYGVIMISMVFVGRTGLYLGVILLLFLLFWGMMHSPRLAWKIISAFLVLACLVIIYINYTPDSSLKTITIKWVGEIFEKGIGEGSTVDALRNMPIPPLTWETFWGTGIVQGKTASGLVVSNDIGYIQSYAALGFIGGALYYAVFYVYMAKQAYRIENRVVRNTLLIYLLFIMIAEGKEPFLRKTPVVTIYMSMAYVQLGVEHSGTRILGHKDSLHMNPSKPT